MMANRAVEKPVSALQGRSDISGAAGPLMARLPKVRGRLAADASLARLSWFRTGGPAEILFEPADEDDLVCFLRGLPGDVPLTVIGVGSNLLVRDGGVDGVVIRLGRAFAGIRARGDMVKAGAGAMDVHVARAAADAGVAGLEFLIGVPGTIGGAIAMNAGAYGHEVADVVQHVRAVDRWGHVQDMTPADLKFSYRRSVVDDRLILLCACLKGMAGQSADIRARMADISAQRSDSQPIGTRTGGSTFKNPVSEAGGGQKAWELIDRAGCRGLAVGDAQVSEKHCNFLINRGRASADDIERLGEMVRARVQDETGVMLDWEIRRIGKPGVSHESGEAQG